MQSPFTTLANLGGSLDGARVYTPPKMKRLRRGSALRGGASVVATGAATGQQTIAAGASGTFTLDIIEDCHLMHLVIFSEASVPLVVTEISVDNDGLLNGEITADVFAKDSTVTPLFGHFVTKNSTVRVVLANRDGTDATIAAVAFTAWPADSR